MHPGKGAVLWGLKDRLMGMGGFFRSKAFEQRIELAVIELARGVVLHNLDSSIEAVK
jgi:hypothetical protein